MLLLLTETTALKTYIQFSLSVQFPLSRPIRALLKEKKGGFCPLNIF